MTGTVILLEDADFANVRKRKGGDVFVIATRNGDSRKMLREIIAQVLESGDFTIVRSDSGKPSLAPPWERLQFNLTHTRGVTLFALAWDARVGIDVERCDREVNVESLTNRFLSSQEREEILAVEDVVGRRERFLRCWTRKEALLKAVGTGLAGGLDKFTVSTGEEARIVQCDPVIFGTAEAWSLQDLAIGPDYFGSVAVETKNHAASSTSAAVVRPASTFCAPSSR